jgi:hypothetical protein
MLTLGAAVLVAYAAFMVVFIARQRRRASGRREDWRPGGFARPQVLRGTKDDIENVDLTQPAADRRHDEAKRTQWERGQRHSDALAVYRSAMKAADAAVNNLRPAPWGMSTGDRLEREVVAATALINLAEAATAYADELEADQRSRGE